MHFAQLANKLCTNCTDEQMILTYRLLPMLCSIMSAPEHSSGADLKEAYQALRKLLSREGSQVVSELCANDFLPVLEQRLKNKKLIVFTELLNTLSLFIKRGEVKHIEQLYFLVPALDNIISDPANNLPIHLAEQCFEELFRKGGVVIEMVLTYAPEVIDNLCFLVEYTENNQTIQVTERSDASISALIQYLFHAQPTQLRLFKNVYDVAFKLSGRSRNFFADYVLEALVSALKRVSCDTGKTFPLLTSVAQLDLIRLKTFSQRLGLLPDN